MKNLLLIPAMVFALATASATDLPTFSIVKDKTFVLNTNDWNTNEVVVSFLTSEGNEIYTEVFAPSDNKLRKYNLKQLPQGDYKVVVSDDFKSITYDFLIKNEELVQLTESDVSFVPQVLTTEDRIDINLLSLSKKVKIYLNDAQGHNLYNTVVKNSPIVTKRMNISKLERGNYTLEISVGDKWYTHTFEK